MLINTDWLEHFIIRANIGFLSFYATINFNVLEKISNCDERDLAATVVDDYPVFSL